MLFAALAFFIFRFFGLFDCAHDNFLHALVIGLGHFNGEAVIVHQGAALVGNILELLHHPTANRCGFSVNLNIKQALKLFDLGAAVDYALTFSKDDGAFMKTANGKYAAYVYVNKIDDSGKMTISIKRYPL